MTSSSSGLGWLALVLWRDVGLVNCWRCNLEHFRHGSVLLRHRLVKTTEEFCSLFNRLDSMRTVL